MRFPSQSLDVGRPLSGTIAALLSEVNLLKTRILPVQPPQFWQSLKDAERFLSRRVSQFNDELHIISQGDIWIPKFSIRGSSRTPRVANPHCGGARARNRLYELLKAGSPS